MKLMIASDLHGSAYHVNELMEALRREQPDKAMCRQEKVRSSSTRYPPTLSSLGIEAEPGLR